MCSDSLRRQGSGRSSSIPCRPMALTFRRTCSAPTGSSIDMGDAVLRLATMLALFAFVVLITQFLVGRFVERSGKRSAVNKRLRLIESGVDRDMVVAMLRKEVPRGLASAPPWLRSERQTSELQS